MTNNADIQEKPLGPDADAVADYLAKHPTFFIGRDELLLKMKLPHDSGEAVSLLEKQLQLLRERTLNQHSRIQDLLENAGDNDALFEKTRMLILTLLNPHSLVELSTCLNKELGQLFNNVESHLFFITDKPEEFDGLTVRSPDQARQVLGDSFGQKRTQCGELRPEQAEFFFPDDPGKITSAALVTIHLPQEEGADPKLVPMLVIGSTDRDYFHSSQDTLFLDFIGEVLSALINNHMTN